MNERIEVARKIASRFSTILSDESLQKLAEMLEPVKLKKGEVLLNKGDILRHITYIYSGLLRQYYYKKGKDVTEHFGCEGTVVVCYHSLFGERPTELMIEAIEPTLIYKINYRKLCNLIDENKEIAVMYRRMLELGLTISQNKADSWRFESANERYERFIKEYPQAARLASVNHIASYLLMAPESLSRVRRGVL